MRFEVPELKRFCFCFPLRYGLIVWAYLSLLTTIVFLYWRIEVIINLVLLQEMTEEIVFISIYIALRIFDVVVNIIFIFAAHLKRVKLLKISLCCNLIFLSLYTIGFLASLFFLLYTVYRRHTYMGWNGVKNIIELVITISAMPFLSILFQLYALLLLWNEIKKLTSNDCPIMFVNHAAEAKCTMECELGIDVAENGEEDEPQTETAEILVEVIEAAPDNLSHNVVETETDDDFDIGATQNQKVVDDDFGSEGLGFEPW